MNSAALRSRRALLFWLVNGKSIDKHSIAGSPLPRREWCLALRVDFAIRMPQASSSSVSQANATIQIGQSTVSSQNTRTQRHLTQRVGLNQATLRTKSL